MVPKCRVGRDGLQTAESIHPICPIPPQVPSPDTALGLDSHFSPSHQPTQGGWGPSALRGLDSCSC